MRIRERYEKVDDVWSSAGVLPTLHPSRVIAAAKALLRSEMGNGYLSRVSGWKLTSGRRHTWPVNGVWYVNQDRGWTSLVHSLSHYVHRRKSGGLLRPHHWKHVTIEARMARTVIRRGLHLSMALPPPKPTAPAPTDERAAKLARRRAQIVVLERRIRFLTTLLKKRRRSAAALERAASRLTPLEAVA
jgi:hypothetical protein